MRQRDPYQRRPSNRPGFTLVELLVVISIILLVAAITLSAVNMSISGDRVRGAARQVQSYLEGARTRAIYGGKTKGAGYQCGVRFIRESSTTTDPNYFLVSSIQYVELDPANASISGGAYELRRLDDVDNSTSAPPSDNIADGPDVVLMRGTVSGPNATNWYTRFQAGLIYDYQFVLINNRKFQIRTTRLTSTVEELLLTSDYSAVASVTNATPAVVAVPSGSAPAYQLLLPPQPMANQDPKQLGNGVVLDLTLSKGLASFNNTPNRIDLMFSPRGTVVGPLSGTGIVEFVLSDRQDSLLRAPLSSSFWQSGVSYSLGQAVVPSLAFSPPGRNGFVYQCTAISGPPPTSGGTEPSWTTTVGDTYTDNNLTWTCRRSSDGCTSAAKERLIVSLTPQTGMTAVHPVYVSQTTEDADPFRYSETGEVAKQ